MTTTQNPTMPNPASTTQPQGFQPIPTRIRDMRDTGVPPLVIEPASDENKAAICQGLGELGVKLSEVHRTAAEAYMSQGLYEEALPHMEAAATFSPTEIEYQMQLGFVRYVTGDDVGAIKSFNHVISEDENNVEGWFNLGMVVFGQEQYTEAEYCFRRACELESTDSQTWNNRGVCLWKLNRIDEARTCFQNSIQIDPSDADAQFNLQNIG